VTGDRVEAVVFDLDGVLVDSEELWDETRRRLAADAGVDWPSEATRAMQGMSTPEWSGYLTGHVGLPGAPADIAATVIDRMASAYERRLPLLPGGVDAVERLADWWPLGLASSSPRRLIDTVLRAAGLASFFRASVSTEEVASGKPAPDVYTAVLEQLGVRSDTCVAIEDSSNGLRAAAAAGLAVIAVPHAAFPPTLDALALAAARIGSLDELTVDVVEEASRRR